MKTLFATSTLVLLISTLCIAPSHAFNYLKIGDIKGEVEGIVKPLQDIKPPDDDQAILIGLLLPAVQKVREATSRLDEQCTDADGALQFECAQKTLAETIASSKAGRDGSPGLLNLLDSALTGGKKTGMGTHIHSALIMMRQASASANAPAATEQLLVGILIGLLKEIDAAGISSDELRMPLIEAIHDADEMDPDFDSAVSKKAPKRGTLATYDLATNKKV